MLMSYPAIFYYTNEGGSVAPFFVHFPDIENSVTQGENISDAMFMASDYLGIMLAHYIEEGLTLPTSSDINKLSIIESYPFKDDEELKDKYDIDKSFVSMVVVDVSKYLDGDKLIKKTLSIPKWANDIAIKRNINFSQLLTNAIMEETIKI